MLDKYTINLLERLVIAEENQVKELKEIRKELQSNKKSIINNDKYFKMEME